MQHAFIRICDRLEYVLSRWWGTALYASTLPLTFLAGGWDGIDRWVYITGVLLVVLLIGNARRSDKATHIKLDEIDPREDHNEIERLDEPEMPSRV